MLELKKTIDKLVNYPAAPATVEQVAQRSKLSLLSAFAGAAVGGLVMGPLGLIVGAVAGWKGGHMLATKPAANERADLLADWGKVAAWPAQPKTLEQAKKRETYELGGIFAGAAIGGALMGPVGVVLGVPLGMKAAHYIARPQP